MMAFTIIISFSNLPVLTSNIQTKPANNLLWQAGLRYENNNQIMMAA
jgi:hypothetical protein